MAREDDLSVNINVGVDLDKASFKEVKEELQFILELQKELGVEGVTKVRVGGYSTGKPEDRVSRNKAARQFEKLGGDFTGVDIADKAQAELAKQFNQASKELAKLFNIDFIPDAAAALGQMEFSMPNAEEIFNNSKSAKDFGDKLQKATDDFFMDAVGEVTISPAMFLAAAEKVMKNNPDMYMPTGMKQAKSLSWMQTGGPISPSSVFSGKQPLEANPQQVARFDEIRNENVAKHGGEKMAAAFNYAVGKDLDEIVIGAWEKASKEVASNKDIQQILKDDPTFSISGIAASDAFANLEIYFMERFIENVKEGELAKGYQASTFASHMETVESASRGGTLLDIPDDPMNVLPKDKIINWLKTMVEDGVMNPLMQVMQNPGILGKSFISDSESSVKSGFTRLINASSGEGALSKKAQEEQKYHNQLMAQAEELSNMAKWLDARITGDLVKNMKIIQDGAVPEISKTPQAKQEAEDFAKGFYNAMRGGEFDSFKGELKSNLQDYEKEQNRLKDVKRFGPMEAPETLAQTRGGGALNPDIDKLRKYLIEQKNLFEKNDKQFMAGLDTEFNYAIDEKLTELGVVIQDGTGKFVEIFKFLQLPGDLDAMARGSKYFPPGSTFTGEDLNKRAKSLGIPKENIGVPGDLEANFLQYREKISKLINVLNLLSELGVTLTGSNFKGAEVSNINKAISYVNSQSEKMGLEELTGYNESLLQNVFDPAKSSNVQAFAKQDTDELTKIFDSPEMKRGVSGALGTLIKNIASEFPEFFAKYADQFRMAEGGRNFEFATAGGWSGAHTAVSDAAASLIVKDFIESKGGAIARGLLVPVVKELDLKASASGGGGGKGPTTPMAAGDKPEDDPAAKRAADSLARIFLLGEEYNRAIAGLTEKEIVQLNKRLNAAKGSNEQLEISAKLAEKEKQLVELRKEINELSQGNMGFIAQQRRGLQGPLTEDQASFVQSGGPQRFDAQAKAAARLKLEINELTIEGQKAELQTIKNIKEELRRGEVSDQLTDNLSKQINVQIETTQAGKTASTSLKAQMQEQVAAQREVQRQTQSLTNTWVTARYALYDVGNFYASVSQRLFQLTTQIFNTSQSLRRFETAFTSVERAMQLPKDAAQDLRDQFILLSETIPVSFEEISKIATLGAQMGIAANGIVQFTETVAQFAAVTGISAETVAQQFGRIAELADVDSTEFVNLGSAVSYAGINAVATESEILTLSQSIAAVSNQVGITAPEIIGLGTALASVGIPAEQARGVFTRVFADIDRSASRGGESLQNLARVTGMSAEQIQASWGKEGVANDVFLALLDGLNASDDLTASFDALNIVETREINTLTRLAKNMNVVRQALSDSGTAYEDASFLSESFEKTVDNIDSKIVIFKNNLDSLLATLSQGFGFGLGIALDVGSEFLKFLKSLENSFLFTAVLPASALLIGITAVMAAGAAAIAKLTAQVYAFRVAMVNTANNPTAVSGFSGQLKALTGLGAGMVELRENVQGVNTRGLIEPVNLGGIFSNQKQQQENLLKERNIYLALGTAMKDTDAARKAGATSAVQLARLEADSVEAAINGQISQIKQLEQNISNLETARVGALTERDRAFTPGVGPVDPAAQFRRDAATANLDLIDSELAVNKAKLASKTTDQMYVQVYKGQTIVIDENTFAKQKNTAADLGASKAARAAAAARVAGTTAVNLETKTASMAAKGLVDFAGKALGVISIIATIATVVDGVITAVSNLNKIDLLGSGGGLESFREAIRQDTRDLASGDQKSSDIIATATIQQTAYKEVVDASADSISNFTGVSSEFTDGFKATTEEIKTQTVALGINTKEWLANAIFQNEKLQEWLKSNPDIFNEMQESMTSMGLSFDGLIKDLVAQSQGANINPLKQVEDSLKVVRQRRDELNLASLGSASSITEAQKTELMQLYQKEALLTKVIALVTEMGGALTGALDMQTFSSAIRGALGLNDEMEKTEEIVTGVGKKIRTLTDYANDLATVLKAAFDIRYGTQVSLDAISKSWIDLNKAAKDAEESIKSANAEINELTVDKSVLEYQLSVAERYNDERRAAVIREKLGKVSQQVADKQKVLADATEQSSTELIGNSTAAINNRAQVRDLVTQYNDYLVALANSGASSETLQTEAKRLAEEFLIQGENLGFSRDELIKYTDAFKIDFTTVIKNLPRDITINANTDPALRALEEFIAKSNSSSATVTITAKTDNTARKEEIAKRLAFLSREFAMDGDRPAGQRMTYQQQQALLAEMGRLQREYASFSTGGFVSGPGTSTSDSIPAMLSKGEYVVRAKSVSAYGLDFMNALNQQRVSFQPASQLASAQNSGNSSVVYLSPEDRALLRAAADRPIALYTENSKIAQSANAGNVLLAQRGSN